MALTKQRKKEMLEKLKESLANTKTCVISDCSQVKVSDMQNIRKELRENNAYLRVLKNSLFKKALKDNKLEVDENILCKPLACAFDEKDEVSPARIIYKNAQKLEKLNILGALVNGEYFGSDKVIELAKMPSREQLYARVVGSIGAPISGFVNVLAGNLRGLVSVLNQYKEQKDK